MTDSILIVGASGRAAAYSARRAGFSPRVADLFADADLAAAGIPAEQVKDYPADFLRVARPAWELPLLYTGALENYPRLVAQLSVGRELLGNREGVLKSVRDPFAVAAGFAEASLPHPAVVDGAKRQSVPRDGTWLAKPRRSAAGQGIVPWGEAAEESVFAGLRRDPFYYLQERIAGRPCSAVYVGHGKGALLLGVTEQLIDMPWCGGRPFGYCGSLGPVLLDEQQRTAWERIGECLAKRHLVRGLFGVDAVVNEAGIWPVEVNPRYTASVELLERAAGERDPLHAIALHVAACRGEPLEQREPVASERGAWHGKAILFASEACVIDIRFTEEALAMRDAAGWPLVADVPHAGSTILAGHPVCTVFAQAATREATLVALQSRQTELRARLSPGVAG